MCPGTWNACPCPWNDPNSSGLINCKSSLHFWILTWHQRIWSLDGHCVISANVLSLHLETGQHLRETISNKWNHDSLFDFQPSNNLCESHFMVVVGGLEPITAAVGVYSLNQLTRANMYRQTTVDTWGQFRVTSSPFAQNASLDCGRCRGTPGGVTKLLLWGNSDALT